MHVQVQNTSGKKLKCLKHGRQEKPKKLERLVYETLF